MTGGRTAPRCAITFDIDWAPDWAVTRCADMCRRHGIPATFFATHAGPGLEALKRDSLFEVGIHPNFLPGSSHGSSFAEVMNACLAMVPNARSMRAHDLFTCSGLFALIAERFSQIETDCSLFLPGYRHCEPINNYFGAPARRIVRLPFSWADSVAARTPDWNWEDDPQVLPGCLSVFNFHPAHIALNLNDPSQYAQLKSRIGARKLMQASEDDFASFAHPGAGARRFLQRLLEIISPGECAKVSDIAAVHRKRIAE